MFVKNAVIAGCGERVGHGTLFLQARLGDVAGGAFQVDGTGEHGERR
jgi:hypothetical protein